MHPACCEHARALGIEGPATLGLAGFDSGTYPFRIIRDESDFGDSAADRAHLVMADQWVEELSTAVDVDAVTRPLLDAYWQCFGEVRCELFDEAGKWRPWT